MENISNMKQATPESVWAILQEVAKSQKELQKTIGGLANNYKDFKIGEAT